MTRITTAIAATALLGGLFLSMVAGEAAQLSGSTPPTLSGNQGTTATDPAANEQIDPQKCMDPRPTATGALSNVTKKFSSTCGTIDPNRK